MGPRATPASRGRVSRPLLGRGRIVGDVDRARRQLVPCFDDFYGTVLDLIPHERDSAIRILDIGAGTGLLAALLAQAFPQAQLTLVDISQEMLEQARKRFGAEPGRFRFHALDFSDEPLWGEYEAAVSALSIHHVSAEAKQLVFQRVYGVLCEGGVFINADQVLGPTREIDRRYHEAWLRQARGRGAAEDDITDALERMQQDDMSTLSWQLEQLEHVGFEMVNCWYKNYGFVVYSGRKGATR